MSKSKRIRLFAGPNGSGKTTLFTELSKQYNAGSFINADLIEKELSEKGLLDLKSFDLVASQKDFDVFEQSSQAQSLIAKAASEKMEIAVEVRENYIVNRSKTTNSYEAALVASFLRGLSIRNKKTFSFETVMSHPSKLDEIKTAKEQGYNIYLYFVCTDDPSVNIARIGNRIKQGGHAVESDKIISRYGNTLLNLYSAIQLAYRAYLFDNSGKKQELIAEFFQGTMELKVNNPPGWFFDYVLPHYSLPPASEKS